MIKIKSKFNLKQKSIWNMSWYQIGSIILMRLEDAVESAKNL